MFSGLNQEFKVRDSAVKGNGKVEQFSCGWGSKQTWEQEWQQQFQNPKEEPKGAPWEVCEGLEPLRGAFQDNSLETLYLFSEALAEC